MASNTALLLFLTRNPTPDGLHRLALAIKLLSNQENMRLLVDFQPDAMSYNTKLAQKASLI